MEETKLEKLIKLAYREWKAGTALKKPARHPDEELFALFLEHRLSGRQAREFKRHLTLCQDCAENLALQARLVPEDIEPPQELLDFLRGVVVQEAQGGVLDIAIRLKGKIMELLSTGGEVLVGQELLAAPILRSRQIRDFKDEITVLKDFGRLRVEVKVSNAVRGAFNLSVKLTDLRNQKAAKDARISLLKGETELESYLSTSGKATFEHVSLGAYTVEITDIENRLAAIKLDIKV